MKAFVHGALLPVVEVYGFGHVFWLLGAFDAHDCCQLSVNGMLEQLAQRLVARLEEDRVHILVFISLRCSMRS